MLGFFLLLEHIFFDELLDHISFNRVLFHFFVVFVFIFFVVKVILVVIFERIETLARAGELPLILFVNLGIQLIFQFVICSFL